MHEAVIFAEGASVDMDTASYQRALGDELRRVRKQRGWTRKDLQARLQSDISLQTLATYELGTRQCTVVRLVELCIAMDHLPQELLARVHDRVFGHDPLGKVKVDLSAIVNDDTAELLPFRRWARDRLASASATTDVHLDPVAIGHLARLCGLEPSELANRLRQFTE